jgi:ferritin-like metal-binding protein YciE
MAFPQTRSPSFLSGCLIAFRRYPAITAFAAAATLVAAAADLALIGAAQRVEYYEISGYMTARNLAQQLRHTAIVALLSKSLAEEENTDQLLNQVARSLMSVAKMPAAIEQSSEAE